MRSWRNQRIQARTSKGWRTVCTKEPRAETSSVLLARLHSVQHVLGTRCSAAQTQQTLFAAFDLGQGHLDFHLHPLTLFMNPR